MNDSLFSLKKDRAGSLLDYSLEIISYILTDWYSKNKYRKDILKKEFEDYCPVIAFDKLGVLVYKLWHYCWVEEGIKSEKELNSLSQEQYQDALTFTFPVDLYRGQHGRGVGIPNIKPIYLTPLLFKLQKIDGLPKYIDIEPPLKSKCTDPRTRIKPAKVTVEPLQNRMKILLTKKEQTLLENICNFVKELSSEEIKALGTHSSYKDTIEDLEFEWNSFGANINKLEKEIVSGRLPFGLILNLYSYIDECMNKSKLNKNRYKDALKISRNQVKIHILKSVLTNKFNNADTIFDNSLNSEIFSIADKILPFIKNLLFIAHYQKEKQKVGIPIKLFNETLNWNDNVKKMQHLKYSCVGVDQAQIFQNPNYQLNDSYKGELLKDIGILKETDKRVLKQIRDELKKLASSKSIYKKMQVILEIARRKKVNSLQELLSLVETYEPIVFMGKTYDKKKDKLIDQVSKNSIKKAIKFCRKLSLIDDDGLLTEAGKKAAQSQNFNSIIVEKITGIFENNKIGTKAINNHIRGLLKADPPILPTAQEIWANYVLDKMSFNEFNRILTLLAHCEGAEFGQKKIYLKINI